MCSSGESIPQSNASNTKAATSNLQAAGPPSAGARVWSVMSFSLSLFHGLDEGDPSSFAVLASTGGELITVVVNSIFSVVSSMMNLRNAMMLWQCRHASCVLRCSKTAAE
jgi:hypothetical protein